MQRGCAVLLHDDEAREVAACAREAFDLASRSIRAPMARALFPGRSRIYCRVEICRTFTDGPDARRPLWGQIEYTAQHGNVLVLLEWIARSRGITLDYADLR